MKNDKKILYYEPNQTIIKYIEPKLILTEQLLAIIKKAWGYLLILIYMFVLYVIQKAVNKDSFEYFYICNFASLFVGLIASSIIIIWQNENKQKETLINFTINNIEKIISTIDGTQLDKYWYLNYKKIFHETKRLATVNLEDVVLRDFDNKSVSYDDFYRLIQNLDSCDVNKIPDSQIIIIANIKYLRNLLYEFVWDLKNRKEYLHNKKLPMRKMGNFT